MVSSHDQNYNLKQMSGSNINLSASSSATETARYIADMLLEMRNLAKTAGHANLQGMLELAYYEASAAAIRVAIPEGESERLHEMGADARKAEAG